MPITETPLTLVGNKTKRVAVYKHESHKLHQAFNVKVTDGTPATIIKGMPVKLESDGTISPYAGSGIYLGIAITDSINPAYGAQRGFPIEVTVAMEGFMIVNAASSAAITPAYVEPTGNLLDNHFVKYANTSSSGTTASNFIALQAATDAGEIIQVLVK